MATCPDTAYFAKVKTSPSGFTPGQPYNLVPNEFAYGEWDVLNRSLAFDAHAAFKRYTDAKPGAEWTADETKTWEGLRDQLYDLDKRYEALPGPRGIFVSGVLLPSVFSDQVQLAEDYACMLQRIDEANIAIGGKPLGPPGTPPSPPMSLLEKIGLVAAITGGGAIILTLVRRAQRSPT